MTIPISSAEPMVHIVLNNSLISFPLLSGFAVLLLIVIIVFSVLIGLIKKLPDHIYKRFENQFNRETELLKLIRSQVEPQKVDTYIKLSQHYSDQFSKSFIKEGKPRDEQIALNIFSLDVSSRLFFFASDETIEKYINFKESKEARSSFDSPFIGLYSELISSMRHDLQNNTKMTSKEFLAITGFKISKKE